MLRSSGDRIEKCKFARAGDAAILLDQGGNTCIGNTLIKPADDGLDVNSNDNVFEKNTIVKAGDDGGWLDDTTGNSFTKNKPKKTNL